MSAAAERREDLCDVDVRGRARGDLPHVGAVLFLPERHRDDDAPQRAYDVDGAAEVGVVKVKSGVEPLVKCEKAPFSALLSKSDASNVRCEITVEETTAAPVKKGDVLGKAEYFAGDRIVGVADVTASDDVPKITFSDIFVRMLGIFSLS